MQVRHMQLNRIGVTLTAYADATEAPNKPADLITTLRMTQAMEAAASILDAYFRRGELPLVGVRQLGYLCIAMSYVVTPKVPEP